MTIPNALTWTRVALMPVLVVVYLWDSPYAAGSAASVFAVAASTDWLDGYLARRLGQESEFGAFLDPVADKLIVATALVLLVANWHSLPVQMAALVILARELVVSALREWLATLGLRHRVAVGRWGKIKTTVQMLAIVLLLALAPGASGVLGMLAIGLLVLAALLSLQSLTLYAFAARAALTERG